jgi:hypothetical protein
MTFSKCLYTISAVISSLQVFAQQHPHHAFFKNKPDSAIQADTVKQTDVIDLLNQAFKRKNASNERPARKANFSIVPNAGYSLTTGYLVDISGNVGFYTSTDHLHQNLSALDEDLDYDSKNQKVALIRGEVWGGNNDYKLVADVRWEQFPEYTYGLGTLTTNNQANPIDFKYQRTYLTVYKKIIPNYYVGMGYNLDYYYGISEKGTLDNTISDFKKYGEPSQTTSSGLDLNFLFDNRKNPINPKNGGYVDITYRQNMDILASNSNWSSLHIDFRRYFKLSTQSNNILAVWSILWFTYGNVPYLDLPATGQDMFNNSGRGYIQGRFTGKNMIYLETEYRFGLTKNGLLGGVVFANGQSLSEYSTNSFKSIAPATGAGLRLKFNKHSDTNVCIDYGYGFKGSQGFFLNLGEVF